MYDPVTSEHCIFCPAFEDSIFCCLSGDLLDQLVRGKEFFTFSAGEKLIHAGTPCTGIICLREGSVAVTTTRDQEHSILHVGRRGEAFGIRDWQVSAHHTRDVVGETSGSCCFIPCELIATLCASAPQLNLAILQQLCRRIDSVQGSDTSLNDQVE